MKRLVKSVGLLLCAAGFFVAAFWSVNADPKSQFQDFLTWSFAALSCVCATVGVGELLYMTCWQYLEKQHNRPVPKLLRMIVAGFIGVVMAAIIAEMILKRPVTSLWAASAFSGIGIILSMKDVFKDIISGVLLNLDQPFQINDKIRISPGDAGTIEGLVVDIDWRTTSVRTLTGDVVVIPNSTITDSALINFHKESRPECCEFRLSVDPGAPVEMARKILLAAITPLPVALKSPPPAVLVSAVESWCVEYTVQFYYDSNTSQPAAARDKAITAALNQLRQNGISLAAQKHEILMQQRAAPALRA